MDASASRSVPRARPRPARRVRPRLDPIDPSPRRPLSRCVPSAPRASTDRPPRPRSSRSPPPSREPTQITRRLVEKLDGVEPSAAAETSGRGSSSPPSPGLPQFGSPFGAFPGGSPAFSAPPLPPLAPTDAERAAYPGLESGLARSERLGAALIKRENEELPKVRAVGERASRGGVFDQRRADAVRGGERGVREVLRGSRRRRSEVRGARSRRTTGARARRWRRSRRGKTGAAAGATTREAADSSSDDDDAA